MHFRKVSGEIEKTGISSNSLVLSSKRKLFQSPDHDKNCSLFLPSTSGMSTFDNDLKNPATKRALFLSPSKSSPIKRSPFKRSPFKRLEAGDKKRKRDDSEDMHPSKMSKIANIRPSETETKGTFDRTASDLNLSLNKSVSSQSGELSVEHKKKLYWAVYEALRSQNITHTHPQFKVYASVLARVTRRFLLNLSNNASRAEGGTSERMSRIARHHVYAVVKGKTVDEIINEYMRNRLRNVKPRGYIGIEEFRERNRELANDKENAIQGRVNATASLEKKKLEQLGSENKIERIRKVINFEDNR
ncbi:hypothetical protein NQ318_022740 [Aromia moschata]|uniref:Uncharacterized protein n=1 Tax=Aromia moschata TaxID=1265417 RepID=A0AAV8YC70_9CUCU|nr:hypothetical protein NQ318_022740 [Aromia moschata]